MLAMTGEWMPYSDQSSDPSLDVAALPDAPTPEDVAALTLRMYEQSPARRRLGMRGREVVQKSFDGARYLREHEQMLWIGKALKDMRRVASEGPDALRTLLRRENSKGNMLASYRHSEIMGYRPRSHAASSSSPDRRRFVDRDGRESNSVPSYTGMSPAPTMVHGRPGVRGSSGRSGSGFGSMEDRLRDEMSIDTRLHMESMARKGAESRFSEISSGTSGMTGEKRVTWR
jgi:hypothetical protein